MKWNLANSRLANGKSQRYIKRCQNAVKQRRFPNKYRIWKYVQFCYNSFILSEFREQLQKLWCNFELCVIMTLKCWHLNFFSEFELYMVASNRTHQHSYKYEERKNRRKNNCAQLQLRCKRLWNLRHVLANQFHTLLDSSWYSQYTQQFLHPSSRFVVVFFLFFSFHIWKFTYSIPSPLIFYSSVNLLSNGRLNRCTSYHIYVYNTHTQ